MENNLSGGATLSAEEKQKKNKKAVVGCFIGCFSLIFLGILVICAVAFFEVISEEESQDVSEMAADARELALELAAKADDGYSDAASERLNGAGAAMRAANSALPAWYPANPDHFRNFHGENLPRVVDNADTLTPEEEAELSAQIENIVQKYDFGFAIFTDSTTHGISMERYSYDFFRYNGYGRGDDFRGSVFFHSLEPGNRGWRTTSVGQARQIFTYDVTNSLDDLIDSDIRAGRHYVAYKKYVAGVEAIYSDAFTLPDWYPAGSDPHTGKITLPGLPSLPNMGKEHLIDNAGLFKEGAERRAIKEKINAFIQNSGYDLVVFTDTGTHSLPKENYARDFYYFNGFSKDGFILFVAKKPGDIWFSLAAIAIGRPYELCPDCDFRSRIDRENGPEGAVNSFLDVASFFSKHERLPPDRDMLLLAFIIAAITNLIATIIIMSALKRSMTVIVPADADSYLDNFNLRTHWSKYLYKRVTKTRKQKSSSGRSGGGSHYSSSGRNY